MRVSNVFRWPFLQSIFQKIAHVFSKVRDGVGPKLIASRLIRSRRWFGFLDRIGMVTKHTLLLSCERLIKQKRWEECRLVLQNFPHEEIPLDQKYRWVKVALELKKIELVDRYIYGELLRMPKMQDIFDLLQVLVDCGENQRIFDCCKHFYVIHYKIDSEKFINLVKHNSRNIEPIKVLLYHPNLKNILEDHSYVMSHFSNEEEKDDPQARYLAQIFFLSYFGRQNFSNFMESYFDHYKKNNIVIPEQVFDEVITLYSQLGEKRNAENMRKSKKLFFEKYALTKK
jgi:hypothetical protein